MKTIERLKELQEVERRACGSSNMMRYVEAVGNTATAAHNALPALLAVVEAAYEYVDRGSGRDDLIAALRALDGETT